MSVKGQTAGIEHGTVKGYRQHRYRGVTYCEACLKAWREQRSRDYADQRAKPAERTPAQAAWYGGKFQGKPRPAEPVTITPRYIAPPDAQRSPGTIAGRDLRVGDTIVFLGQHYRIDRFEPYTGALLGVLGVGTRTACSGEWEMTVGPEAAIRILPRAGEVAS